MDVEHIIEEVESIIHRESSAFAKLVSELLAELFRWQRHQIGRRRIRIGNLREKIRASLTRTPSLRAQIDMEEWWSRAWCDAMVEMFDEAPYLDEFPRKSPWSFDQIMTEGWLPEEKRWKAVMV